jgi:hypothetical protein
VTAPPGDRDRQLHQPTQATLRQLANVVERPAPPEVMARRARALFEIAESLQPQPPIPLWTVIGLQRPATEGDYMTLLRTLCERSGLSYQQIASRTEFDTTVETVPRSTIHGVLRRDRLPRREDQLRALLVVLIKANGGTGADLDSLISLRAELIAARTQAGESAFGVHSEHDAKAADPTASSCPRCQRWRDPLVLAGAASLLLVAVALVILLVFAALHFFL